MISFRKAKKEDIDLYYRWANDPAVRNYSYNKEEIKYDEHVRWFENRLDKPGTVLLVFFDELNTPVGQVRIEGDEKSSLALIGISIDEQFRGKGFAVKMLEEACSYYFNHEKIKTIQANVFKVNISSIKSFIKAGFVVVHEKKISNIDSVEMRLKFKNNAD